MSFSLEREPEQKPVPPMSSNAASMQLPPGFRFHPTDEELILHYLAKRASGEPCPVSIIAEVDIYKFDPWDLPAKAWFGEKEWYFFSPRDRKYPNGLRPNRAAGKGYWKATGTDKPIASSKGNENIGVKKALVFYTGKPPKGTKTDWIMHEYRLAHAHKKKSNNCKSMKLRDSMRLDDWVLCRIYKKSNTQETEKESSSSGEDVDISITASPPRTTTLLRDSILNLPKSYSLSELLSAVDYPEISQLLEHPYDALGLWNSFSQDANNSSSNNRFLIETDSSVLITENNNNSLKRPFRTNYWFQEELKISPAEKKPRTETNLNLPVMVPGSHLC